MYIRKKILFAILIPFILGACSHHKHYNEEHNEAIESHMHHEGHQSDKTLNLELDNGKKWKADQAANDGIGKMIEIASTPLNDESNIQEYNELGDRLQSEVNTIFNKCTMTGKGHDELHKVLVAGIEQVKLLKGNEPEKARAALGELKETLSLYNNYFE